jgi:putative transposase
VQTCVVHLIRNSMRFASKKHWAQIARDLKRVYTASPADRAAQELDTFAECGEARYPAMVAAWRRAWPEFVPFLAFPQEIRRLIYTTNGIESLNARFRQATRRRGHFPNEQSALKVLYLTAIGRQHNRSNPTGPIPGWKSILNTLALTYGDRLTH